MKKNKCKVVFMCDGYECNFFEPDDNFGCKYEIEFANECTCIQARLDALMNSLKQLTDEIYPEEK